MLNTSDLAGRLIRNLNEVHLRHASLEPKYGCSHARLTEGSAARKLAAGLNLVPPGKRACPYHFHHAQEEMFIVLEGHGTLRVAGEMLPVKSGDVICIPPGHEYPHQLINTSDQDLKYIAIGTTDEPEICEYPDSGKYMAESGVATGHAFGVIGRVGQDIDYWEGEK